MSNPEIFDQHAFFAKRGLVQNGNRIRAAAVVWFLLVPPAMLLFMLCAILAEEIRQVLLGVAIDNESVELVVFLILMVFMFLGPINFVIKVFFPLSNYLQRRTRVFSLPDMNEAEALILVARYHARYKLLPTRVRRWLRNLGEQNVALDFANAGT